MEPQGIMLKYFGKEYLFHRDDVKSARQMARKRLLRRDIKNPTQLHVDQQACLILIELGMEQ